MKEIRYSLCPNCDACPEVVIGGETVIIGEEGNQVQLSPDEWEVLVTAVKEGRLDKIRAGERAAACGCGCGCQCCASVN